MLNWFSVETPLKMFKSVMSASNDTVTASQSADHSKNMLKILFYLQGEFLKINLSPQFFLQGGDPPVGEPAGIDVIEVGEITVHVQG